MEVFFFLNGRQIRGNDERVLWTILKEIRAESERLIKEMGGDLEAVKKHMDPKMIKNDFGRNFLQALDAYLKARDTVKTDEPEDIPEMEKAGGKGLKLLLKGPKVAVLKIDEPKLSDLFYVGYLILPIIFDRPLPEKRIKSAKPKNFDEAWAAGLIPYPFLYAKKKIKRRELFL